MLAATLEWVWSSNAAYRHAAAPTAAVAAAAWTAAAHAVAASALLEKTGLAAWLWNFRQRCLLAARSRIKRSQSMDETQHYRDEIDQATRAITGPWAGMLGNLAVALRDVSGQARR